MFPLEYNSHQHKIVTKTLNCCNFKQLIGWSVLGQNAVLTEYQQMYFHQVSSLLQAHLPHTPEPSKSHDILSSCAMQHLPQPVSPRWLPAVRLCGKQWRNGNKLDNAHKGEMWFCTWFCHFCYFVVSCLWDFNGLSLKSIKQCNCSWPGHMGHMFKPCFCCVAHRISLQREGGLLVKLWRNDSFLAWSHCGPLTGRVTPAWPKDQTHRWKDARKDEQTQR